MNTIVRVNLWSGPRNISTAMMYSWAQRDDTVVVDEPLYAHYLRETGLHHPGREAVLNWQENDGRKVIQEMLHQDYNKPVVFFKQMTHHLLNLDWSFLSQMKNILLIRDPKKVLTSYSKVIEQPSLSDIGIRQSYNLFQFLHKKKYPYLVIDSDELLKNPEIMLTMICEHLQILFQKEMLHWKAGPRAEDGVWAKYWYQQVHQSTGFAPAEPHHHELNKNLDNIYLQAKGFYDFLYNQSLRIH